jgi:hypothetical protein
VVVLALVVRREEADFDERDARPVRDAELLPEFRLPEFFRAIANSLPLVSFARSCACWALGGWTRTAPISAKMILFGETGNTAINPRLCQMYLILESGGGFERDIAEQRIEIRTGVADGYFHWRAVSEFQEVIAIDQCFQAVADEKARSAGTPTADWLELVGFLSR